MGPRASRSRARARSRYLRAALDYAEREGLRHFADRARDELRLAARGLGAHS